MLRLTSQVLRLLEQSLTVGLHRAGPGSSPLFASSNRHRFEVFLDSNARRDRIGMFVHKTL